MKMLARTALALSALCACAIGAPLAAQPAPIGSFTWGALTEVTGTVSSSAVTPTKGAGSMSGGVATIGALTPQLGRDIRVVLKGTWAGTFAVGTSSAVNACAAGTVNPLTVAGTPWAVFTGNANEVVDTPTLDGVVYCATATITSGSLTYSLRQ